MNKKHSRLNDKKNANRDCAGNSIGVIISYKGMRALKKREIFRRRIRLLMFGNGLSTKQLAEKAGLSVSHTKNLISGVYSSAPGRRKIECVLGEIWSDLAMKESLNEAEPKPGERS